MNEDPTGLALVAQLGERLRVAVHRSSLRAEAMKIAYQDWEAALQEARLAREAYEAVVNANPAWREIWERAQKGAAPAPAQPAPFPDRPVHGLRLVTGGKA